MNFIFVLVFLLNGFLLAAQRYNPQKVNSRAASLYSKALKEITENNNFVKGLELINEAIIHESFFVDAYLSKAGVYAQLKQYDSSVKYYAQAFIMDSLYCSDFNLPYSISLAGTGKFDRALQTVNTFLNEPEINERSRKSAEYRKKCYEFALTYFETHKNEYVLQMQNLGDSINTSDSEYFPSLTIDASELVFTRRVKGFNEDFFVSNKKNGVWQKASPIQGNINTNNNEGAQNISQDGKMLVYTGCNFEFGKGSCDIYYSIKTKDGWSEPINFDEPINTEFWESQPCLSPDKRDLYFAARDASGIGGSDIWVSHRKPNGKWSNPQNLGRNINTAGDESCPFIHADNQTLYFTSNGLQGYGGTDLFVCRKDSSGKWGKPENLGYPINTINDEGSLIVSADGSTAYYASDRSDSRGGLDLYCFELRNDIQPIKTLWVKGNVYDAKTKAGLPSTVELIDMQFRNTLSQVQTDENGDYMITLPVGKNYVFNVNRKGYLFYSGSFTMEKNISDSVYTVDIALKPIETNETIVLKNIFFETNQWQLQSVSTIELDKVVQLLNESPSLKILITGHTDGIGKAEDNYILSNNRAKSVVQYLISKGINADRLQWKGYGAEKPVADNKTETGRSLNRRTEMTIIQK